MRHAGRSLLLYLMKLYSGIRTDYIVQVDIQDLLILSGLLAFAY